MARENHQRNVGVWFFLSMAVGHIFENVFAAESRIPLITTASIEGEDGDIIDCVNIYQQPAFSHPFLKNHTIQMKPSSYPDGHKAGNFSTIELSQGWHRNGECPRGTIPIARTQSYGRRRAIPVIPTRTRPSAFGDPPVHEYAQVSASGGRYFGAHAYINVWNPATFDGEFSFSQMWVLSGQGTGLNSIEAGWMAKSSEKQTQLFIYWTRDGYQTTGCYNLDCPGFVQTNRKIALGASIEPVSNYNGKQFDIEITIHKDRQSGNWWLNVQDQELGYWPGSILTSLADSSNLINWGGEITNSGLGGHHTSTQMGSGHLPGEGPGKASFFRHLGYIDDSGAMRDPEQLIPFVSNPSCYDLQVAENNKNGYGVHFYYGGPGFSPTCP